MNENTKPMQKAFMEVTTKKLEAQDLKIAEIEKQFNQVSEDYKNLGQSIKSLFPKLNEAIQIFQKANRLLDMLTQLSDQIGTITSKLNIWQNHYI
jgi:effector-binding domain-containing protein